jgi:hypothetical protein
LSINVERLKKNMRYQVYLDWVSKLNDQALLAQLAVYDKDRWVRESAVGKLTDKMLLSNVVTNSKWLDICIAAIGKVSDQTLLHQWAEQDSRAAIRQASVRQLNDDKLLIKLLSAEPSASVRAEIIETLQEKDSLREVALSAYHHEDREQAAQLFTRKNGLGWLFRWADRNRDGAPNVAMAHKALGRRVKALADETDDTKLLKLTLDGEFDTLCAEAARRLNDATMLEQAAMHSRDRRVLRILLAKIEDKSILDRIATCADDRAMRLAALKEIEAKSWQQLFDTATGSGSTVEMLGDVLAALSLFSTVDQQVVGDVQNACLDLIRRGDESRISEMVDLLEGYGDKTLAEDFLNCGQPDLNTAAEKWGNRHGYSLGKSVFGSQRAKWGSSK